MGDAPKAPPPPPPPPPPVVEDAAAKAQDEADRLRRRRGIASTILTGPQGAGTPAVGTKTLLGS